MGRRAQQLVARIARRLVDDVTQQLLQHTAQVRSRREAELEQIAAVDGEVGEAVRLLSFALEHLPEARELLEILGRRRAGLVALAEEVRFFVVDELERELVAVPGEEPARAQVVALPHLEHVMADDAADALAERIRIAQAPQRLAGELGADLLVAAVAVAGLRVVVQPAVGAAPRGARLAEVVEDGGKPHDQCVAAVGGRLHDRERVLVDGQVVVPALLVEADRALELGQHLHEHTGVAREPQRLRRLRAQQQLRQLAHAVCREPAADALS